MMEEWLGVAEGLPFLRFLEMSEIDTRQSSERASEFKAFAIIAAVADGIELSGAIRGEVGRDVTCGTGLASHFAHVVNRQTRLNRDLGRGRIDIEIAIEGKIADYSHTKCAHTIKKRVKAVGAHEVAGNRNLGCAAIVLSIFEAVVQSANL